MLICTVSPDNFTFLSISIFIIALLYMHLLQVPKLGKKCIICKKGRRRVGSTRWVKIFSSFLFKPVFLDIRCHNLLCAIVLKVNT